MFSSTTEAFFFFYFLSLYLFLLLFMVLELLLQRDLSLDNKVSKPKELTISSHTIKGM